MAAPRRNGQLSSCEPCRKSKLRCDHQSPICGRCISQNQAELCFYHPAPLTQSRPCTSRVVSRRPKRQQLPDNQLVFRVNRGISRAASSKPAFLPSVTDVGNMLRDQHIVQWSTKEKRTLGPGVLGLVFPQDIFKEYEDDCAEGPDLQLPAASTDSSTGANQVLLGAQILSHLQKISWFREIIEIKNKIFPGWILGPILARSLFHCLGEMYDHAMRSSQDTNASLASLSRQIFTNTSQDIQVHPGMNPAEYFNLTAARWDTIGLGFALLGTALSLIPDDDPIFTHRNPWKLQRSQLRESAIAMSEICCQFCNNAGTASDPWCWLMIQQTGLLSSAFGDSDYRVWKKLGDLSTIVYAFGLHQVNENIEETVPFFLVEVRKRAMVCAYAMDKQLATTLGRPPRICSRYCSISPPLDISYEDMILPRHERENVLEKLDAGGWNTDGNLTMGVKIRIVLMSSMLRESILELSLSPKSEHIPARVEDLTRESRQMQKDLPSFLQWSPEKAATGAYSSSRHEGRAFAHVEFTYQEFLLQRILLKRFGIASESLLETSLDLITTFLHIIAIQTRPIEIAVDMSWDLCYIGLPAAGILTSSLLSGQQCPHPSNPRSTLLPINFRSMTIQKLSDFVSHLMFLVRPQDGNYEIAQQGARFIRQVLDRISSPETPQPAPMSPDIELPVDWLDSCDLDGNLDFMEWFDNIHWAQDPLFNLT